MKNDRKCAKSLELHLTEIFNFTDEELNRKILNDYIQKLQELPSDNTQINIPKIDEIKE